MGELTEEKINEMLDMIENYSRLVATSDESPPRVNKIVDGFESIYRIRSSSTLFRFAGECKDIATLVKEMCKLPESDTRTKILGDAETTREVARIAAYNELMGIVARQADGGAM